MPLSDTHTLISVQCRTHLVDIRLAHDLEIDVLLAQVITFLRSTFAVDKSRYAEALEWLTDDYAVWQLTTPTGRIFDGAKTMSDVGLRDGDQVILAQSTQRENYRPLIDDVAESIAHYQRLHFGQWVSANARTLSGQVAPLGALIFAAVLIYCVGAHHIGTVGQFVAAGILAFAAAAALIGAAMGYPTVDDGEVFPIVAGVIVAGYVLLGGAGILMVPADGIGPLNLLLGAGLVVMAAVIMTSVLRFPENLNFAAVSVGVLVALSCAIGAAVHASALAAAVGSATAAMLYFLIAPRLALVLARVPAPEVPAQGETFLHDDDDDITSIDANRRSSVIAAIVNQEAQVVTAHQAIVGMVWGALLVITASAIVAGKNLNENAWYVAAFYGVLCAAMLYRGKSFDDSLIQRSWLIAAPATAVAFTATVAVSDTFGEHTMLVITCAALIWLATLIGCYFALRGKVINSPITMKMLEIVESLCYATPAVLLIPILNLWSLARGR